MAKVGSYTTIRKIGAGGMAEVWKAQRESGGVTKLVALKLLPSTYADDPRYREMLAAEARLSMRLSHANIVDVYDACNDASADFIAMQWVDGLDLWHLNERLRERDQRLTVRIIAFIAGELLKALSYAHDFEYEGERHTLVHRDISPQNVMLSTTGEVKLMDFGIARLATDTRDKGDAEATGKLRYMPPEQYNEDSNHPKIDLFAVGAIIHELLDGQLFRANAVDQTHLLTMLYSGEIPKLSADAILAPPPLEQLRRRLLDPDPEMRPDSAREALELLRDWPGYRDARFELEILVRELVAEQRAARRGLSPDPDPIPRANTATSQPGAAPIARVTHTALREAEARAPATSSGRRLAIAAACGLGLILVIISVLLGVEYGAQSQRQLTAPAAAPAEPSPPSRAPAAPSPGPRAAELAPAPPHAAPAPEPAPLSDSSASDPNAFVPGDLSFDDPASEAPASPASRASPWLVPVSISSTEDWIEIEIKPKPSIVLQRVGGTRERTLRLRPGAHTVLYRSSPTGKWRPAGAVRIPQRACELVLEGGQAVIE